MPFSARRVAVAGTSMEPTLQPGDRLLVVDRRRRRPRAGDLVAVRDPRDEARIIVKRVAAVLDGGRRLTVLGDNPDASTDSRVFGAVDQRLVLGRAVYRYAPPQRAGRLRAGIVGTDGDQRRRRTPRSLLHGRGR